MIYFNIDQNGVLGTIYFDTSELPEEYIQTLHSVESLPPLIEKPYKIPYYHYNDSTIEVLYKDRPLTDQEKIKQLQEQSATMMLVLVQNDLI
jgi:hypothetical protein